MSSTVPSLLLALFVSLIASSNYCYAQSCPAHLSFRVEVAPGLASEPLSGRLIVMMSAQPKPTEKITPSFGPEAHSVWVAAKEIHDLTPGTPVELDPDVLAYPQKFCTAPEGSYKIQAVLDVNHDFAYHDDASDGDYVGKVVEQNLSPAKDEVISLTLVERKTDVPLQLAPRTELFDFVSPKLSEFWGRPIHMRGAVLVPPSYSSGKGRYPTVYMTHGFGADMRYLAQRSAGNINKLMEDKKIPEMIWVFMLEACPGGTHEFADSVNNGPWGTALTTELIPGLEKKYRMDAKPSGRFLTGHSSGGWAALWIQVSHPEFFGGTWPTAPDTTDFRTFAAQTDLTKQPPPNFYRAEDGSPRMFIRMDGKDTQSMEDLAMQERVLGDYGGQLASFEWVFSPRGKDGRPMPLFDRDTGNIDPEVAAYWEKHYDIANLLRTNWKKVGSLLNGKIHMTVGTADTFHLDESARLLEQTIKDLGGKASFTYPEGRNHFDLYQGGLAEKIANEMYAVARPGGGLECSWGVSTMSRATGFSSFSPKHLLFRTVLVCVACFGGSAFALGASCAGPQEMESKIRSHPDAATYAELGRWFGDRKQYSCAIEAFRAGLVLEPDSAELSYLLGLTLYATGDPKAAIAPLQQSIQGMPKVIEPHLLLAAAFEELQLRDKAKAEYEVALQIDPHSTKALKGLSKLFLADGNYPAVIGLLRSAPLDETLAMDLAQAYGETRMLTQAAEILVRALRANPSSLRLTNALVTVYVNQANFREAVQVAEKSVRLHPDSMEAQSIYLPVLVLNHEMDIARPLAKKLLAAHSHDFEVLYLNGMLEREAGQYSIARQHLEEAITLNPTHFDARYNLGVVLAEMNDLAGAKVQLEKALALGAGTAEPRVRYKLASVLRALGENEQADEQAKLTAEQLQAGADRALAVVKAEEAETALMAGNPQKAVASYREAVETTPNDALLNFKLAMALDRTGDTADEQAALQQVIKIDPTFALAHNQMGYLASRDGDFASAVEQFRLTVQSAPGYAEGWVNLAAALGMESQFSDALDAVANAIKLDPKNDQALQVRQKLTAAQRQR